MASSVASDTRTRATSASGAPAQLEGPGRVDRVQRQALPLVGVDAEVALGHEDEGRPLPRRQLAVDDPVVGRLRLELVVEHERRTGGDAPAASVGEAPHGHREELVRVLAEDAEGVTVEVALVDETRFGHRSARRHVELAHDLCHRQVGERDDRVLQRLDRRREAEVELVADRIHRHASSERGG